MLASDPKADQGGQESLSTYHFRLIIRCVMRIWKVIVHPGSIAVFLIADAVVNRSIEDQKETILSGLTA